jgi:hypothetical protein
VDIEEFYDADERRRRSAEIELGIDWHDVHDVRYELNWIQDTGELYVMREPPPHEWGDPVGGIHVDVSSHAPLDGMTVAVIGHIETRMELERILAGWETSMAETNSTNWLAERLRAAGAAVESENAPE